MPLQPFTPAEIQAVLEDFKTQQRMARTCFGSGRLRIKTPGGEDDAQIIVAGQRDPYCVRFEITHPWGRPLLHLVMSETAMEAVVFHQKRVYRGKPLDVLPKGSPPIPLAPGILWSLIRGFPAVSDHALRDSEKPGEIALLDQNDGLIEVITFGPDREFPIAVSFSNPALDVYYGPFEDDENGIRSARLVKMVHAESQTSLALELKERVFNRSLPSELFESEVPRGFELRDLSGLETE